MSGEAGLGYPHTHAGQHGLDCGDDRSSPRQGDGTYPTRSDSGLENHLAFLLDEAADLLLRKHEDYGPDNINKSPFGPLFGLLVRLYDKQARAAHLVSQDRDANYESLEDTFMDMLNYSAIALLVLRGQWPKS